MGNKIESASPIGKQTTKEPQQKNREIRKLKSLTRLKPDPNKKNLEGNLTKNGAFQQLSIKKHRMFLKGQFHQTL